MNKLRIIFLMLVLAVSCTKPDDNKEGVSKAITPYNLLNEGGHKVNSHKGATGNSILTFVGDSYVTPGKSSLELEMTVYPRFLKTNDGRYLMAYHDGIYNIESGSTTWSGRNSYLAESTDMKNWTVIKKIFPSQTNVQSMYGDKIITRSYSGTFLARMADGNIIAASAYMGNYDARHRLLDNGLAVKISKDEGRTWSMEQRLNVGMNWEPCVQVLPENSNHPGRVIIYYTDSCPYIDAGANAWKSAIISTGVSYIYSDDNGITWHPDDLLNNHLHAYRYKRDENATWKVYTDQMPGVIQLNDSKQLVGVSESNMAKCSSTVTDYWIGVHYGEKDGTWGEPDAEAVMPKEKVYPFKGCAPAIHQFASGETLISYNYNVDGSNNRFIIRLADETAHNFGEQIKVFEAQPAGGHGFWGESLIDNHILLAAVGGHGGSAGRGYYMQIGQYYLNHNISAASYPVKVDGSNEEWKTTDEALFVGSAGPCHATLRFSSDGTTLYGLAEVDASGSDSGDCVNVYFASREEDSLSENDRWLKVSADGFVRSSYYNGKAWYTDSETLAVAKTCKGEGFYVVEFSLSVASLPVSDGAVKVNYSCVDSKDGTQAIYPVTGTETAKWIELLL